MTHAPSAASGAVLSLRDATAGFGRRTLWSGLDLELQAGEFLAVLGANGTGKSTLLRVILALQPLRAGQVLVDGKPPQLARKLIGYVPQERAVAPTAPLRVRDLVGFGVDGASWGPGRRRLERRARIDAALAAVDATALADRPIAELSGGEAQRARIAQALATDPALLLCDEPLLALDLRRQRAVAELIDRRRRTRGTAVVFVTHEINPVLPYVDRVLYLAGGRFQIGSVDQVMTSESLSALYGAPVEVLRSGDRILVAGLPELTGAGGQHPALDPHPAETNGAER